MNVTLARIELGYAGLYALRDKVAKLNKRATRCGVSEIVITIVREFTLTDEITNRDIQRYNVEINGCAPCINGWYLAARIENNKTIGTVVRVVPGRFESDDYSAYRTYDFGRDICEHCKTCRYRKDVYVLKNDEGFARVIGRNCLANYLRCENADDFTKYAEFVDECSGYTDASLRDDADKMGFGGHEHRPNLPLASFLTAVQCCTRRMGWVSRSAAFTDDALQATADASYFVVYGHGEFWREFIKRNELFETAEDRDLARRAVEWASGLTDCKGEYLDIIRRIAIAGETDEKLSGYAASIIRAYQKDWEWAMEKSVGSKDKVHIGFIKERLKDRIVKVLRVQYFETDFGTRTIIAMELALPDGVIAPLTWFATGSLEFEEGRSYTFAGTVKDHKDDKFGKQTIVNRCKLLEV